MGKNGKKEIRQMNQNYARGDCKKKKKIMAWKVFVDAGRRNGMCAIGVVIKKRGDTLFKYGSIIPSCSVHAAELQAIIKGIECCLEMGLDRLTVHSDSLLNVKQINKEWRIKNSFLKKLHLKLNDLLEKLEYFRIKHIKRRANQEADSICSKLLRGE